MFSIEGHFGSAVIVAPFRFAENLVFGDSISPDILKRVVSMISVSEPSVRTVSIHWTALESANDSGIF